MRWSNSSFAMLYLHLRWCFFKKALLFIYQLIGTGQVQPSSEWFSLSGISTGKATAYDQNKFIARYWEGARLALHVDRLSTHVLSAILCLAKVYDSDDVFSFINPLLCEMMNDYTRKMLTTPTHSNPAQQQMLSYKWTKATKAKLAMNCEFPKPGREGGLAASDFGQSRKFTAGENFSRHNARNWPQVILQPGQLLLYESARLPHGRTSFLRSGWHFDHHHILFILMMTFLIIYHTLPLVQLIAINMPLRIPPLHPFSHGHNTCWVFL